MSERFLHGLRRAVRHERRRLAKYSQGHVRCALVIILLLLHTAPRRRRSSSSPLHCACRCPCHSSSSSLQTLTPPSVQHNTMRFPPKQTNYLIKCAQVLMMRRTWIDFSQGKGPIVALLPNLWSTGPALPSEFVQTAYRLACLQSHRPDSRHARGGHDGKGRAGQKDKGSTSKRGRGKGRPLSSIHI